jgi:hypothetical protein
VLKAALSAAFRKNQLRQAAGTKHRNCLAGPLPLRPFHKRLSRMKRTPFTDKHIALGAKMAEFAGYNMPISYTSINEEHNTVRNNAGVFDVSHMGEFLLKGPGALELFQRITTNDAS